MLFGVMNCCVSCGRRSSSLRAIASTSCMFSCSTGIIGWPPTASAAAISDLYQSDLEMPGGVVGEEVLDEFIAGHRDMPVFRFDLAEESDADSVR